MEQLLGLFANPDADLTSLLARLVDEMHQAHTVIRTDSASRASNPDTHLQAYGLGWFLQDYRGKVLVHHGGNVDGFTALVAMMPLLSIQAVGFYYEHIAKRPQEEAAVYGDYDIIELWEASA